MPCVSPDKLNYNDQNFRGMFTFPCPNLPEPITYGLTTYTLALEQLNSLGRRYKIVNGGRVGNTHSGCRNYY